jgi:hypothetical protein
MNLGIHLDIDASKLAPFRGALSQASAGLQRADCAELARTARVLHGRLRPHRSDAARGDMAYVGLIPQIADLLDDPDWQLGDAACHSLAGALSYFNDPDDLIPDRHPTFGLLDDAIVIGLALNDSRHEWLAWQEFAALRRHHPRIGPMDLARWNALRTELPRLCAGRPSSYLQPRFLAVDGRSRYRMLGDLPRIDMA